MEIKKKISRFLLLAVFASATFSYPLDLMEEIRERRIPSYIIENTSYISLRDLLRIIDCEGSWGMVQDRVFIMHEAGEIKFQLGGTQVIFGEEKTELDAPVKEREGEVLVPVNGFTALFASLEPPSHSMPGMEWAMDSVIEKQAQINKERFVVLIDPGHGGRDAGAIGPSGLQEKKVVLDISLRMEDFLKKALRRSPHVELHMTRNRDIFVSLEERVQMAIDIDANIFFSVHANASLNRRQVSDGFETYYSTEKEYMVVLPPPSSIDGHGLEDEKERNSDLFKIIQDLSMTTAVDESRILAEFVQEYLAKTLVSPDRGTKRRNFYVLRYTPMPAVLTEVGFLCNPNVEWNLRDTSVRQAIAESLGNALLDYLAFRNIIPGR